jgi:hypothetical protein
MTRDSRAATAIARERLVVLHSVLPTSLVTYAVICPCIYFNINSRICRIREMHYVIDIESLRVFGHGITAKQSAYDARERTSFGKDQHLERLLFRGDFTPTNVFY